MEMVYGIVDYYRGQVYVNQVGDVDRATAWRMICRIVPSLPILPSEEHGLTLRREIGDVRELLREGE